MEEPSFLGLAHLLVLALFSSRKHLTGSIQQLILPLNHLDWLDRVIDVDLLDRLAATARLHGDSGLELRTVDAVLAHEGELPFQVRYPSSEANDGTCL